MSSDSLANWLTLGVASVTAWMAWETRRMATATREVAELEALPFLSFVAIGFEQKMKEATAFQPERVNGLRPNVQFRNPSRVRVTYDVHEIDFSLEGRNYPAKDFFNHIGVIHPDETTTFLYPVVDTGFVIAPGMTGELSLKVMFWRTTDKRETLSLKLRFDVSRIEDKLHVGWVFLEGPTYS